MAIGPEVTIRAAPGNEIGGGTGVGFTWRIAHDKTGWGWQYGLNWFSTDVGATGGSSARDLGELHVRPLLGGYGYTRVVGRYAITGSMLAGYAFSTISIAPGASDAYRRLGAQSVDVDASNPLVFKPELGVWIDLNKKMGLNLNAGYVVARPTLTIRTGLGTESRDVVADIFQLKIGLVYSIF